MMAALEAALSAQSSKYATVSQQLRLELKEGLTKANQVCVGAGVGEVGGGDWHVLQDTTSSRQLDSTRPC